MNEHQDHEYHYFLNNKSLANGRVQLALDDIKTSGLNPSILKGAHVKLFSGNPDDLKKELGFSNLNGNSILSVSVLTEFPYFDENGKKICSNFKLNPPTDGYKYLRPKGIPARPYILLSVWEAKNKTNKPLWFTEGEKKTLIFAQYGKFPIGLTGVWNFKAGKTSEETDNKYLWQDLKDFDLKGRTAYLAFDNDLWTNPHVRYALYELTIKLYAEGAIVKIATWKGPKGIDDYLVTQPDPLQALENLEEKATQLEKFPEPGHLEEVIRALAIVNGNIDTVRYEALIGAMAKRFNVRPKQLHIAIASKTTTEEKELYTDEEKEQALTLLKSPYLRNKFSNFCHKRYIGRDKLLLSLKYATMTRHFDRGLSIVTLGASSSGKSEMTETVLKTCHQPHVENFTRTSALYLLYRKEPLDHRIVTFYELNGAHESAPIIRSALSEGTLKHGTVMKGSTGTIEPVEINKDTKGLVILSTFTGNTLDYELSTRVLKQEITHDQELARKVYHLKNNSEKGLSNEFEKESKIWQCADFLIEPKAVEIPYLAKLADLFPTNEERFMRDFDKVILLIKASALWHQYQRKQTEDNKIIAGQEDYCHIYQLADIFAQTTLPVNESLINFLQFLSQYQEGEEFTSITRLDLETLMQRPERTIKYWVKKAEQRGYLELEGKGKKQKYKVIEIPTSQNVLPEPENVFGEDFFLTCHCPFAQSAQTVDSVCEESTNRGFAYLCPIAQKNQKQANRQDRAKGGLSMENVDSQRFSSNGQTGKAEERENDFVEDFIHEEEIPNVEGERWQY